MRPARLLALPVAVVAVATVGCGRGDAVDDRSIDVPAVAASATPADPPVADGDGVSPVTADADPARAFSAADIEFVVAMLGHHTAAQQMAEVAERRAGSPEVRTFATSSRSAQQPEIDQMQRWLASLGVDPATVGGGHDHGGATPQQVRDLEELEGPAFDRAFLDLAVDHSLGAATLARAAAAEGFNTGVRQLAARIVDREWVDLLTVRRLG